MRRSSGGSSDDSTDSLLHNDSGAGSSNNPRNYTSVDIDTTSVSRSTSVATDSIANALEAVTTAVEAIGVGRGTWLMMRILGLGNAADAVEVLSIGYIIVPGVYNSDGSDGLTKQESEILTAAVFAGMLVGGLLWGTMSDKFGRRPCLLISRVSVWLLIRQM